MSANAVRTYTSTRVRGLADWTPQAKTRLRLGQIQTILEEYRDHLPLTCRQIFYRLVGAFGYDKTEQAYDRLLETLNRARRAGLVPFDSIRDDGMTEDAPNGFSGLPGFSDAVRSAARDYRRDRQAEQPVAVEVWVEAGGTREALEAMAAALLETSLETEVDGDGGDEPKDTDGDSGRDPSCAAQLIVIGRKALLFADERGDGYGAFEQGSVRRLLKIRSSDFSSELCRRFAESYGYQKAANGEAVSAARNVLEALARHQGETHHLNTRFARFDGAVWIDMADPPWRAIRVTPGRWEIVDCPPLLFRRFPHMRPLPEPIRGGDLSQLFRPFNLSAEARLLLTAWVVVAPLSDIPRPLLLPHGPQGSGKSTLLKMISATLDPSGIDDLDLGGDPRELAQLLDQHAVPFFDNVVKIPDAAARLLCKAATGGGFEKRKLFTDEESVILTFKRAVMISSINVPSHAPDLLDRCQLQPLDRIPPASRKLEADLWRDFNAARPSILGGLLDALARAMAVYPTLDLPELPRMADYGAWGAAVSEGAPSDAFASSLTTDDGQELHGAEAFLYAYRQNVSRQTEEVLEADPVARAVRDFANQRGSWEGTASDLFAALKVKYEDEMKAKDGGWPRRADGLSRRLEVLHSTLADAGVTIKRYREGKNRTRMLSIGADKTRTDASAASAPSAERQPCMFPADAKADTNENERVRHGVRLKPVPAADADAADAADADSRHSVASDVRKVVNL